MKVLSACLGACALLVSSCAVDPLNTDPEVKGLRVASKLKSYADPVSGTALSVKQYRQFELFLPENPSTGYRWELKPGWSGTLNFDESTYIADPAPEGLVGSGGTRRFVFSGATAGKTNLTFRYKRPGPEAEPADVRTFPVTVTE